LTFILAINIFTIIQKIYKTTEGKMSALIFFAKRLQVVLYVLCASLLVMCGGDTSGTNDSGNDDPVTTTQKWTIMYYGDGDNNLEQFIMQDVNELESVDLSSKNINIIALVDRVDGHWSGDSNWTDTRAFKIGYDSAGYNTTLSSATKRIAIPSLGVTTTGTKELNMGSATTLQNFVSFCKSSYPAEHYMLVMSNHGGGWRDNTNEKATRIKKMGMQNQKAVCWDDTSSDACLYTKDVRTALEAGMGATKLDIIAFDACLMGMVEVAYELKGTANYLVASEETIPGLGYPYNKVLTDAKNYTGDIPPVEFAKIIVNDYTDAYVNDTNIEGSDLENDVTLSVTDLSKIDTLVTAVNNLGTNLPSNLAFDPRFECDYFADIENVDLYDYCTKLKAFNSAYGTYCDAVTAALTDAVVLSRVGALGIHKNAKGLAIYFPRDGSHIYSSDYSATYLNFPGVAAGWKDFVQNYTPTCTDSVEIATTYDSDYGYIMGNNDLNGAYYNNALSSGSGNAKTGYVFVPNDEDAFYLHVTGTTLQINFTRPSGSDYVYDLYAIVNNDGDIGVIATGLTGTSNSSAFYYNYFIVVRSPGGFSSKTDTYSVWWQ
jgi:clostripain